MSMNRNEHNLGLKVEQRERLVDGSQHHILLTHTTPQPRACQQTIRLMVEPEVPRRNHSEMKCQSRQTSFGFDWTKLKPEGDRSQWSGQRNDERIHMLQHIERTWCRLVHGLLCPCESKTSHDDVKRAMEAAAIYRDITCCAA
jgi:hypothetical protein